MPAGAVYVGRPTRFGNPFYVGRVIDRIELMPVRGDREPVTREMVVRDVQHAVDAYRCWLEGAPLIDEVPPTLEEIRMALRGKNVCCWCRLDGPCHGDVLLQISSEGLA